ncbi:MAG: DUF2256 and DUF3253 domain-containing protein [Gemmatimonadetes bacterium]|nr:DUF2256 and DUF3253 domain-containing protein [Gemmatimonadota bacterium]
MDVGAVVRGDEKTCASCGRTFEWRKKWARDWEHVRYCSRRCRSRGVRQKDEDLERAVLELLAARAGGSTICPSEAARRVRPEAWRGLMEDARAAGRRLAARGRVRFLQKGREVDPSRARGPIRLGRGPEFGF